MFTKQKPLLAAALKNWHSCQFSLCGCKDADRNGNVPVGWAGGSAALIHSHPALCCSSGNSQGTNAPLHIHPEALRALWESALLPCPAEEQGDNSLPGLRKFLPSSPNAWQKNEQQQRQYLPARQQILANLLPEMPACLYLTCSAVWCIFISPRCRTFLSARILWKRLFCSVTDWHQCTC